MVDANTETTLYERTPKQEGRHGYVVVGHYDPNKYILARLCPFCGKGSQVTIPSQGLWDWEHGKFVQDAMPDLTPAEREIVMTGTHQKCFDDAFADDEDYDPQGEEPVEGCPDCGKDTLVTDPSDEDQTVCANCGWRA